MMQTAVIIPTYNERENIVDLVTQILALPIEAYVIVVDDNSPDGTGQLIDHLRKENGSIHVIHRPKKLGLGTAHIAGIKAALTQGAEYILTMDADFSHHPRYIPDLIALAQTRHIVIGSRYVPGGGVENWGLHRRILSGWANRVARLGLGLKIHDCTAGFRCYRRDVLLNLDLDSIFSNGYSFLLEMAFKCSKLNCTFGETPIVFVNRTQGSSKISQTEIFKAMWTVFRLGLMRLRFRQSQQTSVNPISQASAVDISPDS